MSKFFVLLLVLALLATPVTVLAQDAPTASAPEPAVPAEAQENCATLSDRPQSEELNIGEPYYLDVYWSPTTDCLSIVGIFVDIHLNINSANVPNPEACTLNPSRSYLSCVLSGTNQQRITVAIIPQRITEQDEPTNIAVRASNSDGDWYQQYQVKLGGGSITALPLIGGAAVATTATAEQ